VDAKRHILRASVLVTKIEHTDLSIRNTTAIPTLDVRLALHVAVATTRTPSHVLQQKNKNKQKQKKKKKNKNIYILI